MVKSAYTLGQKTHYRITLELDVLEDFNPHQIDWNKVLQLEPAERVKSYVENLDAPTSW